jgi:hypothetical protein
MRAPNSRSPPATPAAAPTSPVSCCISFLPPSPLSRHHGGQRATLALIRVVSQAGGVRARPFLRFLEFLDRLPASADGSRADAPADAGAAGLAAAEAIAQGSEATSQARTTTQGPGGALSPLAARRRR